MPRKLFETRPHPARATQSYAMARRLHSKHPGPNILRAVRRRLMELPWPTGAMSAEGEAIADAVAIVDLCISRCNSDLQF